MNKLLFALVIISSVSTKAQHQIKIGSSPRERIVISDSTKTNVRDTIQKAIDSVSALGGGVVYLQPGLFKIEHYSQALKIQNTANVSLVGLNGAIIRQIASCSTSDAFIYVNNSSNIIIQNVRFEGIGNSSTNGDVDYHRAILIDGANSNVKVADCYFSGFKTGGVVVQNGATNISVSNNTFNSVDNLYDGSGSGSGGDYGAIHMDDATDVLITDNKIYNARQSGISFGKVTKATISRNIVYFDQTSSRTMGIFSTLGIQNSIISNNQFYGVWNEGLDLRTSGSGGVSVSNNVISQNIITAKYIGISINASASCSDGSDASNNILSENRISGFTPNGGSLDKVDHGVLLVRSNYTVVLGNQITEAQTGVSTQQCTHRTTIASNHITNSENGVSLNGRGNVAGNYINVSETGVSLGSGGLVRMVVNNMITASDKIYRESTADTVRIRYYCAETNVCDSP